MKYMLIMLFLATSLLSRDTQLTAKEQSALEKTLQDEKKFAQEQKFYKADEYDFISQEVDKSALDNLEDEGIGAEIDAANEDFDMDDVY